MILNILIIEAGVQQTREFMQSCRLRLSYHYDSLIIADILLYFYIYFSLIENSH